MTNRGLCGGMVQALLLCGLADGWAGEVTMPESIAGWGAIVDPTGDCQIRHADGKLTIKIPGSYCDLWPVKGQVNAPLVLDEVEGDFSAAVLVANVSPAERDTRIAGLAGSTSFHAGTLVIWKDGKNFVRLDRTNLDRDGRTVTGVYLHVFKNGERTAEVAPLVPDKPTHLRIARKGDRVRAAYSQNGGRSWQELQEQTIELPAQVKVGVAALNNTTTGNTVQFEDLRITR
jgi:hypothetical protein